MFAFLALPTTHQTKVRVSQQDINLGRPNDANRCAIARAIRRQYWLQPLTVKVTETSVLVRPMFRGPRLYVLDEAGKGFIRQFDAGCRMHPKTLRMTLVGA